MTATLIAAGESVKVGDHPVFTIGGALSIHSDTLLATGVAGLIIIALGFYMRMRITAGVPSKLQLVFESLVRYIEDQVESAMGVKTAPFVVPLAVTLFAFILIANWLEVIPTEDHLPSPTADINLTAAMALLVVIWAHLAGFRHKGIGGYVKSFLGNLFAGGLMIGLIALFPAYILWAPTVVWKLFDMFIGGIQALIFSLLTIVYFSFAVSKEGH